MDSYIQLKAEKTFDACSRFGENQGWVFSGKNLFFPGRVEKTGENLFFPGFFQFLPEKTGKKWKKPRNYYVYYILI